ncbi:hypothetical protein DEJ48_02365 [Streptomyces venezuelae]|uniref:Uncharacterized protein n=1 Tax=Streptomyces venezuelae TaxID=54571 RepID=A0A5P2BPK2_STRVZ|nr:hypothetical protein DEJ48_02365 [Streptomyces venezuelae]
MWPVQLAFQRQMVPMTACGAGSTRDAASHRRIRHRYAIGTKTFAVRIASSIMPPSTAAPHQITNPVSVSGQSGVVFAVGAAREPQPL